MPNFAATSGESGKPESVPRVLLAMLIVIALVPGGIFFAKGALNLVDRFASRTTVDGTIFSAQVEESITNRGRVIRRYEIRGVDADGESFGFDDRRVFAFAEARIPLAVDVERSGLTGRVVAIRSDFGSVDRVGGATGLPLTLLAIVFGAIMAALPLALPWFTNERNTAKREGRPLPRPDWGAFAIVAVAAVLTVGSTLAWDLSRAA